MHPGFMPWWKRAHFEQFARAGCGEGPFGDGGRHHGRGGFEAHGFGHHGDEGGGFGVRRPLRFLAYKLDLSEAQVASLAKVLDELKTERAQASVDDRRAVASLADSVSGESFDAAKAAAAAKGRVESAERLNAAVSQALGRIHALLEPEQRERLAYLVRTGVLAL